MCAPCHSFTAKVIFLGGRIPEHFPTQARVFVRAVRQPVTLDTISQDGNTFHVSIQFKNQPEIVVPDVRVVLRASEFIAIGRVCDVEAVHVPTPFGTSCIFGLGDEGVRDATETSDSDDARVTGESDSDGVASGQDYGETLGECVSNCQKPVQGVNTHTAPSTVHVPSQPTTVQLSSKVTIV
jgi:hypothetical protein